MLFLANADFMLVCGMEKFYLMGLGVMLCSSDLFSSSILWCLEKHIFLCK